MNYSMEQLLVMVEEKATEMDVDRIISAQNVYSKLYQYSLLEQEHFILLCVDGNSRIISETMLFKGTVNQSMVHNREIFRQAIKDNACGIIIAHNHPSGSLEASRADISMTMKVKEASKIIGIELLDHVILSKHGYYSMSEDDVI